MLLSRRDFRSIIFYEYAKGSTSSECHESLSRLFGSKAIPKLNVIERYYAEFHKTKSYLDEPKLGSKYPRVLTTEYAEAARKLLRRSPRITFIELAQAQGISITAARVLLEEHLEMRRRWGYWLPKSQTAAQKEDRLDWCRLIVRTFDNGCNEKFEHIATGGELWLYRYEEEEEEKEEKNSNGTTGGSWSLNNEDEMKSELKRVVEKRMIVCFFTKNNYLATILLDPSLSRVTVGWCINIMIPELKTEWKLKNPEDPELIIHHEKTNELTAAKTMKFMHANNARLFPHPDYSPDLLPFDYFLFPKLKEVLGTRSFTSTKDAIHAIQAYVNGLEKDTWSQAFKTWLRRIKLCTKAEGAYFEES